MNTSDRVCKICGEKAKPQISEHLCEIHYKDKYHCKDIARARSRRKAMIDALGAQCHDCGSRDTKSLIATGKDPDTGITPAAVPSCSEAKFTHALQYFSLTCSVCSPKLGKKPRKRVVADEKDSFLGSYPMYADAWSKHNDATPDAVHKYSQEIMLWDCSECGDSWQMSCEDAVVLITIDGLFACPQCSKKLRDKNYHATTVAVTHPKIAAMFSDNSAYAPNEITYGSRATVTVDFDCGHSREIRLGNYCNSDGSFTMPTCTQCAPDRKSLAAIRPDLQHEFSPENERSFTSLTYNSAYRATWVCEKGHTWKAAVYQRVNQDTACPVCTPVGTSKGEEEIYEYVVSILDDTDTVIRNDRGLLQGKEVDVYIPTRSVAIEYNGLYWHEESKMSSRYAHHEKYAALQKDGVQLITVWEDDWKDHKQIVMSMLAHKLGVSSQRKVFARKTTVAETDAGEMQSFMNDNHIQGHKRGTLYVGLYDQDNVLVAGSVWRKYKQTLYLDRYATSAVVVGGLGKLLRHVTDIARQQGIDEIVTFSSNEVSDGGLYESLGFAATAQLKPDYQYVYRKKRYHKSNFRKKRFENDPELVFSPDMSESELASYNAIARVYDSGKTRWSMQL